MVFRLAILLFLVPFFGCSFKAPFDPKIRIALESMPRSFDPRHAADADSQYLEGLVHGTLFYWDEIGNLQKDLVQDYQWADSTKLKIKIHKNRKFSNGAPVRAQDIQATYESLMRSLDSPRKSAFKSVLAFEVTADDELWIKLKEPDPELLNNLVVGILPELLSVQNRLEKATEVIGCGSYKIERAQPNRISLVPNPYAFHKPKNLGIDIRVVQDEGTRFAEILSGELDLVQGLLDYQRISQIEKMNSKKIEIQKRWSIQTAYIGLNFREPIFRNLKVRKALSLSLDRKILVDSLLHGYAQISQGFFPKQHPWALQNNFNYEFSLKKAKDLLDEAGLRDPDGDGPKPRVKWVLKTTTNLLRSMIARAIADQWSQVGIELQVQSLDWGRFKQDVESGQAQLWTLNWVGFKGPSILGFSLGSSYVPPMGANRGAYQSPELDRLIRNLELELDPLKRKNLSDQAQQIVQEEFPYLFLWHEELFAVHASSLQGFVVYPDGQLRSLINVEKKRIQE